MFGQKQNYSSKHLDRTSTGPGSEQLRRLNSILVSSGTYKPVCIFTEASSFK